MTDAERAEAMAFLQCPDIIEETIKDLTAFSTLSIFLK
jgi:hypothetical protein